ncbi:MAG: M20/M25/M40 family metallo-hydrolase [bacterium]|nr:M20/M25/M40 family metallo-hydrolase [bacterium]
MRIRFLAVALCCAIATSALALTQAEIDRGSRRAAGGLKGVTRTLAGDRFQGRDNDTQGSFDTQAYLVKKLRRLGAGPAPGAGDAAYKQPFTLSGQTGTNLLAVIPGRDLPHEYVVVGAHYDHLDTRSNAAGNCSANGAPGGAVCHGATDNAAGVAAVLAIGRAVKKLRTPPRRSIVLALWDSEEDGLVGSRYYTQNPLVPLVQTKGYINFDIMGQNLLPSLRNTSFSIGAETGGSAFQAFVAEAAEAEGLGTLPLSFIFGQLRSDYVNFVTASVPTVFFSDADGACYHTVGDTIRIVNMKKLKAQSRIAYRVAMALAEGATTPAFVAPNPALAVYADALSLGQAVALGQTDLGLFAPPQQATLTGLQATLSQIIADGPAAFDASDVNALLGAAVQTVGTIKTLECGPMK